MLCGLPSWCVRRRRPIAPEALALPSLDDVIRDHSLQVLQACGGNRVKAAGVLGIDRKTLYRMLRRWNEQQSSAPAASDDSDSAPHSHG